MRREIDLQQNYMKNQPFSRVQSLKGKIGIISFVLFMPACCYILINFVLLFDNFKLIFQWFLPTLSGSHFEYYGTQILLNFVIIMSFTSYFQTIKLSSQSPTHKLPRFETKPIQGIDDIYYSIKGCQVCSNSWKPHRTHHCSTCQACISGMDHHCPWTVCCVGYRNHKSFLLFSIYMFIGAALYCYQSIKFTLYETNQGTFWEHSFLFYAFWTFTSMVLFPTTCGLMMIILFHSQIAMGNVKTMETMKGISLPCQGPPTEMTGKVNPYDIGLFGNLQSFFGRNIFLFWWPTEVTNDHEFLKAQISLLYQYALRLKLKTLIR